MNRQQREIYLVLTDEIGCQICTACKYGEFTGSACDDGYMECNHKLNDYSGFPLFEADGDLEPGMDCWGFKPNIQVQDLADIAGLVLAHGWDDWFWRVFKDGTIKVYGRDSSKVEVKA